MNLLREVIQELFGMFWADAGLCLGCLGVVSAVGIGHRIGWLGPSLALVALVVGIVATLLVNVWMASVRLGRAG